ncbi:MAG: tyrosine-type recombinase/integrase [Rhodobacteraceae bacterium]|nr:tyrosine-type recombinase/integrase [Paracoccaceae bacterium]
MGVTEDRGRFYFVMRVPKRYLKVDSRSQVRQALHTDSRSEAIRKAPAIEEQFIAYWEDLLAGNDADAISRWDTARRLAASKGFVYKPIEELASGPIEDLLARLEEISSKGALSPSNVVSAVLGTAEAPRPVLSTVVQEYFELTRDRLKGKSPDQIRRWQNPRLRAVRNFIGQIADKPIGGITREDALVFRNWWSNRVAGGMDASSANKDFGHLSDLFRTWCELKGHDLDNPFARLRFQEGEKKTGAPFSPDWIANHLLAKDAFIGLGDEARDIFLVMINTGARPSEIIDANPEDFSVDAEIPVFSIKPNSKRALKTRQSRRDIPLLGVSLKAAKRLIKSDGLARYKGKSAHWSAAINKHLTENNLRETPRHTAYSLRHSFEDRMLEGGIDDRIRAELMGHKYARPAYGLGGALETKRDLLKPISF